MAIEDILRALDEQADADCRALVDNAKVQAKSILGEAKAEADRVRDAKVGATELQAGARATQIVNAAKLERKRQIAAAQDAGIDAVYAAAGTTLGASRGAGSYDSLFRALAQEATAGSTGDVEVQVAPGDADLAAKVMSELGVKAEIETEPKILGGLTVVSGAGRVFRRNTFESRLAKVRKVVRSRIAEILFA